MDITPDRSLDRALISRLFSHRQLTLEEVRQLTAELVRQAAAYEAEQHAHGLRYLTITHDDLSIPHDEQILGRMWRTVQERHGQALLRTIISLNMGNTTWYAHGPDADQTINALADLVGELLPGHRIVHTSRAGMRSHAELAAPTMST